MRKTFFASVFGLSSILLCVSCGDNSSKTESSSVDSIKPTHTEMADTTSTVAKMGTTNEFASKATIGGMTEVEMGKLAQANGGSAGVKEYGKMLETDHAAANAELASIAAAEDINLPTAMDDEHSRNVKDMASKTGADFDKAFIPMMVEDHEKDIAEFKKAAENNSNQKIKDFASKALPTLQKHLDKAKMLKSKMK